jgi:hypothetical protein
MLTGTAALALAAAAPAHASGGTHIIIRHQRPAITLVAVTPSPGDLAGAGGVFNVDLVALARNGAGNRELSAANGYEPGILSATAAGASRPDSFAPGLVVLLSTTPGAVGGPDANLAGLFQLTDVASVNHHNEVFADWEIGKPGKFGNKGTEVTLFAFLVKGKAPGNLSAQSSTKIISNVVTETFRVG